MPPVQWIRAQAATNSIATDKRGLRRATAAPISAISISGSIGQSKSASNSTSSSSTAQGSNLAAGGTLNITANGDKASGNGNLTMIGTQASAGKEANLSATGNIDLLAAANTSEMRSSNSGSNASMGATFALGGQQNGLSFQAGAQGSKGKANGDETTYSNTTIRVGSKDAPGTLNISSGGNTTLKGATASANTVNADIKGNLTIESLQDTSNYDSKQTSVGAGVSVCIPPICYGTMVAVNVNAAQTKIKGDHDSVGTQSAIQAGDGGFNVQVGGKTELVGGAITSTDKAVTDQKNQFTSTGGITTQDLQNTSALNASSVSVNVSVSGGGTSAGSTGGMAGYGSVNDKQTSTTQAGITGLAGNTAARTGDASTGLKPVFTQADVEKINKSLSTQTAITGEFGKNSAKFVGDTAGKKQKELTDQASAAKAAGQADEASRLTAEALLWAEGGAYRVSMHLVAGAMGGGVNGAAGAAASAATAGVMDKVQAQMQASLVAGGLNADVAKATASLLTAGASAAIAGAAGGVQGATTGFNVDLNNRQLHPGEIKRIKDLAGKDAQKEARLTAAACAMARCYAEYPEGSTAYNELKILADAGSSASFANERQLLQNQTGLFTYTTAGLVNDQNIDAAKQINNTYQIGTRVVGAGQATLGAVAIAGGVVTAPASCATGVGCVANAFVIASGADAVYTGSKQVVSGQAENSLTSQALQSLGMSQEAAMYAEFALGVGASAKVGQVLNSATNQLAKTNNVSSASYKDFTTQSIKATPDVMANPQVQAMMTEVKTANPGLSQGTIDKLVRELVESGSALPASATAAAGSILIKIVPKGEGVATYSPYWMTPEQARAIGTMTPEQASVALGLPAKQAAQILNGGADFYAITPKAGTLPKVFVSDIAPTTQGGYVTAPNAQQVIVSNRSLWNQPVPVNPLTLR